MKSTILLTFLFGFISLSCFSQLKNKSEFDLTTSASSINDLEYHVKPLDFKTNQQIGTSLDYDKYLALPELKIEEDNGSNKLALVEGKSKFDNMPCAKPEVKSNMPVLKPDSTSKYTLLIKKIR